MNSKSFTCHCGCGVNKVSDILLTRLHEMEKWIRFEIVVNSGYRCKKHNKEIPGHSNESLHCQGLAADIHVKDNMISIPELKKWAEEPNYFYEHGIGIYKNFLHVDLGPRRRWDGRKKKGDL